VTIRLRTNVIVQVCCITMAISINEFTIFGKTPTKAIVVIVALVQALTSYLAHSSTPAGTSLVDRNLKKMT
jgi:hypothetical protein